MSSKPIISLTVVLLKYWVVLECQQNSKIVETKTSTSKSWILPLPFHQVYFYFGGIKIETLFSASGS